MHATVSRRLLRCAVVPLALWVPLLMACPARHIEASAGDLRKIRTIAILARTADPESNLAAVDPAGAAGFVRGAEGRAADKEIQGKLQRSMTRFVVARRFEGGVTQGLPKGLFQLASPTRVGEALELLLVDQKDSDPDYEKLRPLKVDAVLEVRVKELGLAKVSAQNPPGGYARGVARLVTLDGSTVWQLPFDVDESRDRGGDVDVKAFAADFDSMWRLTVDRLASTLGEQVGRALGGRTSRPAPSGAPAPTPSPQEDVPPNAAE